MLDFSLIEESNNLERMSVCRLLRFEKVTNLRTSSSPQIVLSKFVVLVDRQKPHETTILLSPRGLYEDILGRPEDQLGTPASGTPDTEIVKVGLELGDIVARGLDGRNTGGVLLPETAVVGGVF
jgi:hypothetical protein